MSSTYTPSLTLTQIGNGEQSGTWGTTTNTNWQLIEDAVAGVATVTVSGTSGATLSVANGASDQARKAVIVVTGSTSGTNAIVAPLEPKVYIISNQTTGGFPITIGASTGSVVTIPNGLTTLVYCDGTNFNSGITGFTGGNLSITGTINATGTITAPVINASLYGGAAGNIPYQTGSSSTGYISAPPSSGSSTFLAYTPGTGFNWQTSSTTASNINGGGANQLVYQTNFGVTSFISAPSGSNQILQYNGSQIVWTSGGAVSSVNATSPLQSSGGTSPTISLISTTGSGAVVQANSPTITTPNVVGVTNGSNVSSGYVGEVVTSNGTNVSLTSGVTATICTVSLGAGVWLINGVGSANQGSGSSALAVAFITDLNTTGTIDSSAGFFESGAGITAISLPYTLYLNVSSTTTVYLSVNCGFSGGTFIGHGSITAIRIR